MENSFILERLPAELRVRIYEDVFEGALIIVGILVGIGDGWYKKDPNKHTVRYKFNSKCSLAATCRAIRADSAD